VVDGAFSVCGSDLPSPDDTLWFSVSSGAEADIALELTKHECAFPIEGAPPQIEQAAPNPCHGRMHWELSPILGLVWPGERYEEVKRIGREAVVEWAERRSQEATAASRHSPRLSLGTIPKRGLGGPNFGVLALMWSLRLVEGLVLWLGKHQRKAALGLLMLLLVSRRRRQMGLAP